MARRITAHTAILGSGVDKVNDRFELVDVSDLADAATGTNKRMSPDEVENIWVAGALVGTTDSQALTNKTLGDTNIINAQDDAFTIDDAADATLQIDFNAAGTTGTKTTITSSQTSSRIITLPDAADTLMGKATTDTMTNKTFDANGTGNSLSNVDVADLANGTDGELITWDSSGVPTTVPAGTIGQILTSGGAGAEPTFQDQVILSKSITIEAPGAAEDLSIFFSNLAITITEIRAVLVGSSTPSVTWTVRHGTDRSAAGAEAVTGGTTTTSVTTGSDVTSFNDATVVADSFLFLETTAQSGTVNELHVTIFYTED